MRERLSPTAKGYMWWCGGGDGFPKLLQRDGDVRKEKKKKKKDGQTHLTSSRVNHGLCKSNIFMFCVV